jgi:hypothetical protein
MQQFVDEKLLKRAHDYAVEFLRNLPARHVGARATREEMLAMFRAPLSDAGEDPMKVIDLLASSAERGVGGTAAPRYYGFVIGGSLPVAVAADWITTGSGTGSCHVADRLGARRSRRQPPTCSIFRARRASDL